MDFSSTGAMKSPFSPRVRQSITGRRPIGLSSAKKNQSKLVQSSSDSTGDVVYKTQNITVETYGLPLPVMVTEALTFASGDVSVRLSPCGWCWLVSGRRVLAWARTPMHSGVSSPAPPTSHTARELTLPQTDLAHKADLVVLFYEDGAQMPSCIGVSPEGTVRYWPSIGQEGVYVDVSCELAGQECDRLGEYTSDGLLLATTTCSLVFLNPTVIDGRATVTCRMLRPPSGWLGGIGRRVSLLFFGSMPANADTKLVGVVVLEDRSGGPSTVALVGGSGGGPTLQLWRGAELHEHELRRTIAETHAHGDLSGLELSALGVRGAGPLALLLLLAASPAGPAPRAPDTRHAIAHVSVEDIQRPVVGWLAWLRWGEGEPRFLPLGAAALLYTPSCLALVHTSVSNDKVEYINVSSEGDEILGAELCGGVPLLFSRKHGVLALSTTDTAPSACESPIGSPCPTDMYDGNLSLYEIDPNEVSAVTTDACGKLRAAFLFHVRRDGAASRALLRQLTGRAGAGPEADVDAALDRAVLRVAQGLVDDMPAGDPRWRARAGSGPHVALGGSTALQLAAQLRDKQRAFALFVDFLRATGVWQQLGLVSNESGSGCTRTTLALGELAERLAAARALRRVHQAPGPLAPLMDAAVCQVVNDEVAQGEEDSEVVEALASGALTPADVCYRRVTRVPRLLRALAQLARGDQDDTPSAPAHVARTIEILTNVLSEMSRSRAQWHAQAQEEAPAPSPTHKALLPALIDLHTHAVTRSAGDCPSPALRAQLLEASASLADLLLSDARLLAAPQFALYRTQLIRPYLEEGQTERAAALAEKFQDFELLVAMCVDTDDMPRLYGYIDKYQNEGMAETAFAWLADLGGSGASRLVRDVGSRYGARLATWLGAPGALQRAPLAALQWLAARDHARAAPALLRLAEQETDSVQRMTTMASLAKLCAVAADERDNVPSGLWQKVETRLALADQHAALPRDIRVHHGLDTEDTKVQLPEDLVQMYIDSESQSLTEYDYKKALDLTDFIEDSERRDELRLRVWCASIRRDSWSDRAEREDEPADLLARKTFFKLIDLVHLMGGDVSLLLPAAEDLLTAPELAPQLSDARARYLLAYGMQSLLGHGGASHG